MKNLRFCKESLKKLIAGASAIVMMSLSSCGTKIPQNDKISDTQNSSVTTVDESSSMVTADKNSSSEVDNNVVKEETDYSKTGIYTENDWNKFEKRVYLSLEDTSINISESDLNTALLMLNQEYLTNTNQEKTQLILDNYFKNSEGVNVYDDANQLFQLLAEVRNYNTEYYADNNIYSLSNFLIPELVSADDMAVIVKLEEYVSVVRAYYKNTDYVPSKDEVIDIFNSVKEFGMGTGKIAGKTQVSLSNGAIFITENLVQEISVMCQEVVPKKQRAELDDKLNSINCLDNLEKSWAAMAYYVDRNTDTKFDETLYNNILNKRESLSSLVKQCTAVSDDNFDALYAIANIDFFMRDTKNVLIFEKLYGEDFNITEAYKSAEDAVAQINFYNYSIDTTKSDKEVFDLSEIFIDSKEDSLSVKGIVSAIDNLNSKDTNKINKAAKFLLDYSKYSNLATVNAYDPDTDETLLLDKNSLSKGGTQVVNWLTTYAMVTYRKEINNELYVKNTLALVDGTSDISNIYAEIVVMYDEHCALRNTEEYNYKPAKMIK